ncbi:MAG: AAA family ATPase [Gammaproteobacteria bacterium RIFCSPHIGHO2_12_FULL_41_15]|nr:MAG: AAA family ATPase [Gammaproteobacteria bacterium RIFCSPHIGHO2_12_FULL_41_15]
MESVVNVESASHLYSSFQSLQTHLNQQIIGQESLVDRLLIALLADGHLIVEGVPGLAKTTAIKKMAECIHGDFQRIQFTPDLLPADITGTEVFRPQEATFEFQQGPIFHNLILADEINRAPAKVQAALLEAMAERQVSIGRKTYPLPKLFLVMATQNPLEQEGTYSLPEAQLDRFLMYVKIHYPDAAAEKNILQLVRSQAQKTVQATTVQISQQTILEARKQCQQLHMADSIEEYIVQLVLATRNPEKYDRDLARYLRFGASPRATIGLDKCARSHAWLQGRDFVSPEDVQAIVYDVLRHRVLLTFEAEAEGIKSEQLISRLLELVPVP